MKKLSYHFFILLFVITIFLTFFESMLLYFHAPINSHELLDIQAHESTWIYLLQQKYLSFIELEGYNIHEKRHLLDVKKLLEQVHLLWFWLLGANFVGLVFVRQKLQKFFQKSASFALLILLVSVFFFLNFLQNFQWLHQQFFTQNTWVFPNNSLLISLFPLEYFKEFFLIFYLQCLLFFSLLYFFTSKKLKK